MLFGWTSNYIMQAKLFEWLSRLHHIGFFFCKNTMHWVTYSVSSFVGISDYSKVTIKVGQIGQSQWLVLEQGQQQQKLDQSSIERLVNFKETDEVKRDIVRKLYDLEIDRGGQTKPVQKREFKGKGWLNERSVDVSPAPYHHNLCCRLWWILSKMKGRVVKERGESSMRRER